jgi:hypothetical protein
MEPLVVNYMSLIYHHDYPTHHPLVHHPLKTSNMDEPQLSIQGGTIHWKPPLWMNRKWVTKIPPW